MCRFNKFFGLSLLKTAVSAVNRFTHALVRKVLVLLWPLSDGILYIQRTIVKYLTKTMKIIIDFFFIWKKCDIRNGPLENLSGVGAGEVPKKNSRKRKLNENKFLHAN